mmetsp:Transcript_45741/g.106191  ORF Transcript_45741/g.106191 Transcript_45741/m.106191 type:complete len:536 (+) Transcript_45741:117-1724(+)
MLQWLSHKPHDATPSSFSTVQEELQKLYSQKLLPLEQDHLYHSFYSPELTDADFTSRPMVLLLGQYSTGKSTFIRHLLECDYPGLRIGPEPTTDRFTCIVHGEKEQTIPGNALVTDTSLPFTQLSHFGNSFLSRLECARMPSPVLEGMTLIDTPGVLAGEKQRIKRGYDFESVVSWFSDRVDIILLLFDVSKLDISDEFKRVIAAVRGNDHKIHIILNKADGVTTQQLLRVYGALMWSLGRVMDSAEVARVFVGSFWDQPLQNEAQRELFEQEENELYTKLAQLPRSATVRKVNDLIKRARLAKVHAILLDHLYASMPTFWGWEREKENLIANLRQIYDTISREHNLALGDFPNPTDMKDRLQILDWSKFKRLDPAKLADVESLVRDHVPGLLQLIPDEQERLGTDRIAALPQISENPSPFAVMKVGGATEKSSFQSEWLVAPDLDAYRAEFEELADQNGKVSGVKAKGHMIKSRLPSTVLHKIWTFADVDKDGMLTLAEFALAMHLMKMKQAGLDLPWSLPPEMLPEELRGLPQ